MRSTLETGRLGELEDQTRLLPSGAGSPAAINTGAFVAAARDEEDDLTRVSVQGPASQGAPARDEKPDAREQLKQTLLAGGGARIGRYVLLRLLGEGGMGVVFAAYDEELDRRIALKILSLPKEHAVHGRVRMQREAQALAKLSHPNVVQIYDVGDYEQQLYLAMEFVEGMPLHDWTKERDPSRSWRDVLAVYIPAGRGLAAAHRAGLVHRDFKPQNVILGVDGRPRVLDFGLAKQEGVGLSSSDDFQPVPLEASSDSLSLDSGVSSYSRVAASTLTAQLTEIGSVIGTPAYMSPEQFASQDATTRSDQFSFCVALYEALYGERPFKAKGRRQYELHVRTGSFADPPRGAGVPPWLLRVLHRGMAPDPGERWPSMDALLDALSRDPGRARLRVGAVLGLTAAVAGTAYGLARLQGPDEPVCTGGAEQLAEVWGDAQREALARAFTEAGVTYGDEVSERVSAQLDAYTERWSQARRESCELHERRELSDALLDLRYACLDERLRAVRARVSLFHEADASTVENAAKAVSQLPTLTRCSDNAYLQAAVKPPEDPEIARAVDDIKEELALARANIDAGHYTAGADAARELLTRAHELGYEPLIGRVSFVVGLGETELGHPESAIKTFKSAYHTALAVGDDEGAALAASYIVFVYGVNMAEHQEAKRWMPHARSLVRRAGDDVAASLILENALGAMAQKTSNPDAAEEHFRRAIELCERLESHRDVRMAMLYSNLAGSYAAQQRWREHEETARTAIEMMESEYGPHHPVLAMTLTNVGAGYHYQGRTKDALEVMGKALKIAEEALGPEHESLATMLQNIGAIQNNAGDREAALTSYQRALGIRERALGPESPRLAGLVNNIAEIHRMRGELDEAKAMFERALELHERGVGPQHASLLLFLSGYARTLLEAGDPQEASATLERGLALEGADKLEKAIHAEVYYTLARARYELAGESKSKRAKALALAREAVGYYEAYGEGFAKDRAEVVAWIEARGG